jgi:hypothetical protein
MKLSSTLISVQIRRLISCVGFVLFLAFVQPLSADDKNDIKQFLNEVFQNQIPKPQRVWVNKEKQLLIKQKFNPSQVKMSYRYWQKDQITVWILDEIGKEQDITTGIVITDNKIDKVQVLVYRESRGGQVQSQRFTQQYNNKTINNNFIKEIDSISGATLSVNALNKQVQMALWLNQNK